MPATENAKDRLLAEFPRLIQQQAFASLRLEQICKAAKVHRGSFYHAFPNKVEWAKASLQKHWQMSQTLLDPVFSPTRLAWERLDAYVALLEKTQCGQECVGGCPFFTIGTELSQQEPELRETVCEILAGFRRYFESTVRDGQTEGSIRAGNPEELAEAVFQLIEGNLSQARIEQDGSRVSSLRTSLRWLLQPSG